MIARGKWVVMIPLALASCGATAQIEPGVEHYTAAANAIAMRRAAERMSAIDELARRQAELIAAQRAALAEEQRRRERIVLLWAREVQRRAGLRDALEPGEGWHEVKRGD